MHATGSPAPAVPTAYNAWLHRYAVLVAGSTLVLLVAGGLVTSTGSGLAVPDWPLSFGQVFPRMEGGVLFEHGHRMIAAVVGFLTVVLALWLWRAEPRRWVRRLGAAAVVAVVLQGVLGGVGVLLRLPDATSIGHAGLAQAFFCVTVVLAVVTGPGWFTEWPAAADSGRPSTRTVAVLAVAVVYLQVLAGALVRHTGSALAVPDFPLAYGRLWPPIYSSMVAYHMAHRVGALVAGTVVLWAIVRVLRTHARQPLLRRPALALVALLVTQVGLGAAIIWTHRAVIPATAHLVVGALLLATTLLLAVRCRRLLGEPIG